MNPLTHDQRELLQTMVRSCDPIREALAQMCEQLANSCVWTAAESCGVCTAFTAATKADMAFDNFRLTLATVLARKPLEQERQKCPESV